MSLQLPARCQLDPQFRKGHTCDGHRALDTPVSLLGTGQVGFLQVHAGPGGRDGVSICSHRPAFTCLLRNRDAPQTVRRILFLGSKTSGGGCIQEPAQFGTWGKKSSKSLERKKNKGGNRNSRPRLGRTYVQTLVSRLLEAGSQRDPCGSRGPCTQEVPGSAAGKTWGLQRPVPGLATGPSGTAWNPDTPPGQLHTLLGTPHSDLGSVCCFCVLCPSLALGDPSGPVWPPTAPLERVQQLLPSPL